MSPNGVRLYAEFLLNISQVTIFATLDLTGREEDTAHFSSDRKRIEITYAGGKAAITYPNGISGTAIVHLPVKAAAQLSLRLEITEKSDPYWKNSLETLNDSPWVAYLFSQQTTVACRWCRAVLCASDQIHTWRDLPRNDWAETMDLWHCHKPDSPPGKVHGGQEFGEKTGTPTSRPGFAFVDARDFLVHSCDTTAQKVFSSSLDALKQDTKKASYLKANMQAILRS